MWLRKRKSKRPWDEEPIGTIGKINSVKQTDSGIEVHGEFYVGAKPILNEDGYIVGIEFKKEK